MLLGILERLIDALANSDGRHHNDELSPTIKTIELKHRLGIDVGLTGARFHFYIKVHRSRARCQTRRLHNAITALNLINVGEKRCRAQGNGSIGIALRSLNLRLKARQSLGAVTAHRTAQIAEIERCADVRLARKDISHRTSGLSLIRLDFKLELHLSTPLLFSSK